REIIIGRGVISRRICPAQCKNFTFSVRWSCWLAALLDNGSQSVSMSLTRRQFLRAALTGAAALPLIGKGFAAKSLASRLRSALGDIALLDELECAAFEFFWNEANPVTGLVLDRANANGGGPRNMASI